MDKSKSKIESIFPLSFMQQGLLFHSISNSIDQGLLLVQAKLTGEIDLTFFETAWNMCISRHQVLRSTVHWEKLDRPLQVVHQQKKVLFNYSDWKAKSKEEQYKEWELLKKECFINGSDLEKNPLLKVFLIQTKDNGYQLLWQVHHLLLDGWSSSIILNDILSYYEALKLEKEPVFEILPSHKSYLNWLSQRNSNMAKDFWKLYFEGFNKTNLFCNKKVIKNKNPQISKTNILSADIVKEMVDFSRQTKITINTLLQGVWSLTLCRYFNTTDIIHGATVSGRSSDFPNIHLLAGMYMNIQPVRGRISLKEQSIPEWLRDLQDSQQHALMYEYLGLDQLISCIKQRLNHKLFDSLFIYENYPVVESNISSIGVSEFKSGLTSTYPVTMVAIPGDSIQLILTVESDLLNKDTADWLMDSFKTILKSIIGNELRSLVDLPSLIECYQRKEPVMSNSSESFKPKYCPPRNELETRLISLWEHVLGVLNVGINDNFFDLGGDSLSAVQIISKANKLGIKIAPNQLFQHQTISELSNAFIDYEKPQEKYSHLVEIKTTGNKAPLYCLHAGGIHVFTYNRLASYIDFERPIYALQSSPLNEKMKFHKSIEELAKGFVDEICMLQPKGPYHIMAYCYSTAVGLEVANLLHQKNEPVNFIVVDTIADYYQLFSFSNALRRIANILKALNKEFGNTLVRMVKRRFNRHVKSRLIRRQRTQGDLKAEKLKNIYIGIYKKYNWRTFSGKITLLMTNSWDARMYSETIKSWKRISEKELNLIPIEGRHEELYLEPTIENTSKVLDENMLDFESKMD